MIKRVSLLLFFIVPLAFLSEYPDYNALAQNSPKFLTLPFADPAIQIRQGWRYDSPIGPPDDPYRHRGIDYIKVRSGGNLFNKWDWEEFDVVAAADGKAIVSSSLNANKKGYGYFVYIRHAQIDEEGKGYYTLYAHLKKDSWDVPYRTLAQLREDIEKGDFYQWVDVRRGQKIGVADDTGSPTLIHLHFEVQRGGYPKNKTDPFDIYQDRSFYPGGDRFSACGPDSLWIQCPPTIFTPPQLLESPWPMYQHDPQHTGRSQYTGPQSSNITWSSEIEENQGFWDLVIGKDNILYASARSRYNEKEGFLYAINPDGTIKWTRGPFTSAPMLAIGRDNNLYLSVGYTGVADCLWYEAPKGKLYALNTEGQTEWVFEQNIGWPSTPTVDSDGTIYFVARDVSNNCELRLWAVKPDGSLKWNYELWPWSSNLPAIGHDGTIYVAASARLYAIAPNGTLKWVYETPTEQEFGTTPSIGEDGTIYAGTLEDYPIRGMVYAIYPNGTLKWTSPELGYYIKHPLSIGPDETIYSREGTFSRLIALNPDGTIKWSDADRYESGALIGADGTIYVTYLNGRGVRAISPDGTTKWYYVPYWSIYWGGRPRAIGSDGTLYFTVDNKLYAFSHGPITHLSSNRH